MSSKIAGVVTKLVAALEPLENAQERLRAIQAAMTVYGDSIPIPAASGPVAAAPEDARRENESDSADGTHPTARAWMKRHGLTKSQIEQVFHIDGNNVSLLSAIGKGKRQQTVNTYLLTGIAELIRVGKGEFTDESARQNCVSLGCYDVPNHNKSLNVFGNRITGSKKGGWKLTAPGLAEAAAILKGSGAQENG